MKTGRTLGWAVIMSACLLGGTSAWSQTPATEHGYDGDMPSKTSQRDNEDQETTLDWVGLFGLAGLVGVIGPRKRREQRRTTLRTAIVVTAVIATSALLTTGTPALSQEVESQRSDDGNAAETSTPNGRGEPKGSIGWIGLFGLAGLPGLGLPKFGKKHTDTAH